MKEPVINITKDILRLVAELDEFKGEWKAVGNHPFQDGNGSLSRILTTLLLSQNGYSYIPYSSLESIVEQNKDNYYLALRKAQRTLDTDDSGLETCILFFLNCLKKQKDNLVQKIEREHKMIKFPVLSNQILEIIKKHGQATISDIQSITNANRNTIKIRLRELVADKYLVKNGRGKSTWYTIGRVKLFLGRIPFFEH